MHKIFQCESYDTTQSCLSQNAFYGNKHNPTCEMCVNFLDENVHFLFFGWQLPNSPPLSLLLPSSCVYVCIYDSQIVRHNPCFNLLILHNNSGGFCCTWTSTSSLQCKLVYTTETAFLSNSLVGSFTHYRHSPTSGFQNNI